MQPNGVDQIYWDAAQIAAPDERDAFLARACSGDAELRRRVEQLLEARSKAEGFLESPADPLGATADEPLWECPGAVIGPYKLLEQIGEGGMGAVFMAAQTQPVRRKVALKLIKPGMGSRQVAARFEAERQALALMDHPNIARVFDGGQTDRGRPFFAMELVKGVTITKYCDTSRLTPRQRLELFIPACQAVQHAHQKGVIHRDLKPSNVLVALYDGKPVPKVIDFGVAKAVGQPLTEKTLFTGFGAVVGTLEYMSPEQAELNQLDIDTRSDVYSLGVLLYELLTGTTPLERKRLKDTGLLEALRLIREEEPPRPSVRLSTAEELPAIAANRGLEPRKLSGAVRGELDWIVMKALEKDRNRRYGSADGLARDIGRYLRDEPVLACPPSAAYRIGKFARRNRTALTTAAVIALAVVLAVGALGWAVRDREARKVEADKDRAARQLKDDQERAAREAETDRQADGAMVEALLQLDHGDWPKARASLQQAQWVLAAGGSDAARRRLARTTADLQMADVLEGNRLGSPWALLIDPQAAAGGRRPATANYATALDYTTAFQDYGIDLLTLDAPEAASRIQQSAIHAQLTAALDDWIWRKRVQLDDARRLLSTSDHLHPEVVARKEGVLRAETAAYERLRAVADLMAPNELCRRVHDPEVQQDRQALAALADRPEVADLPPASAILLARLLDRAGETSRAADLMAASQRRSPDDYLINRELAWLLVKPVGDKPGRVDEAIGYMRAAMALRPNSWVLRLAVADLLHQTGRLDQAVGEYRRIVETSPGQVLLVYPGLAQALEDSGNEVEAVAVYEQIVAQHRTPAGGASPAAVDAAAVGLYGPPFGPAPLLAASAFSRIPAPFSREQALSAALTDLGRACRRAGRWAEAVAAFREAAQWAPNDARIPCETALLLADCPDPQFRDPAEAIRLVGQAAEWQPNFLERDLGFALGAARYRSGDLEGAVAALEKARFTSSSYMGRSDFFRAMAHWKRGERGPALGAYGAGVALTTARKNAAHKGGKYAAEAKEEEADLERLAAEAKGLIGLETTRVLPPDEAVAECQEAVRAKPNDAQAHLCLAVALYHKGLPDQVIQECREAAQLKADCFEAYALLGYVLVRQGKTDEAVVVWREAVNRYESAPPNPPGADLEGLDRVYEQLGLTVRNQGRLEEARSLLERGIRIQKANPDLRSEGVDGGIARGRLGASLVELTETLVRLKEHAEAARAASELPGLSASPGRGYDLAAQYLARCVQLAEGDDKLREAERQKAAQEYAGRAKKFVGEAAKAITAATPRPLPADAKDKGLNALADGWLSLAYISLDLGDPAAARDATTNAVNLAPDNLERCCAHASILLLAGDEARYRRLCGRVLERFGRTKDRREAYLVARICALAPDAVPDPAVLAPVAQRAVDGAPPAGWSLHTLGMAYYRAGKFEQAVQTFQQSLDVKPPWTAEVCNWLGLATAHQRLGHADEARKWLDKAVQWSDGAAAGVPRASVGPLPGIHPHDGLACRLARREAERLIAEAASPPPKDK